VAGASPPPIQAAQVDVDLKAATGNRRGLFHSGVGGWQQIRIGSMLLSQLFLVIALSTVALSGSLYDHTGTHT
jgi:hypothetical protein